MIDCNLVKLTNNLDQVGCLGWQGFGNNSKCLWVGDGCGEKKKDESETKELQRRRQKDSKTSCATYRSWIPYNILQRPKQCRCNGRDEECLNNRKRR